MALIFILTGFLQAKEPFIVTIPAMKRLVGGRESIVTWSGSDVLHLVQQVFLLFGKVWDLIAKNLSIDCTCENLVGSEFYALLDTLTLFSFGAADMIEC